MLHDQFLLQRYNLCLIRLNTKLYYQSIPENNNYLHDNYMIFVVDFDIYYNNNRDNYLVVFQ